MGRPESIGANYRIEVEAELKRNLCDVLHIEGMNTKFWLSNCREIPT